MAVYVDCNAVWAAGWTTMYEGQHIKLDVTHCEGAAYPVASNLRALPPQVMTMSL